MIKQELERLISDAVRKAQTAGELPALAVPDVPLERPQRPEHGDYASSLALRLSRSARMSPLEMAKVIAAHVEVDEALASADVAPPGFVNFRLAPSWLASPAGAGAGAGGALRGRAAGRRSLPPGGVRLREPRRPDPRRQRPRPRPR